MVNILHMKSSFPIEDEIDGDVTGDKNNEIDVSLSARFAAHNKIWPNNITYSYSNQRDALLDAQGRRWYMHAAGGLVCTRKSHE